MEFKGNREQRWGREKARSLLFCHLVDILSLVLLSIKGALVLPWWLRGKESIADVGDAGLIPGSGISHGGGMATNSSIFA